MLLACKGTWPALFPTASMGWGPHGHALAQKSGHCNVWKRVRARGL